MPISNSTDRFNGVLASLAIKVPCVVASDVDLVLSGEQTVNGIAVTTNDRVLVMSQTDATENGIYDVTSTAWNRSADFDGNRDVTTDTIVVAGVFGTDPIMYHITSSLPITIGSSSIVWDVFFDPSAVSGIPVLTDINTATPPTTEAVTGAYDIWDADTTDQLAECGFAGSNQLVLSNLMHGGSIAFTQEDPVGAQVSMRFDGANAGFPQLILPGVPLSSALPALAFGDGDTGLFEAADDQLRFTNGGLQTFEIDSISFASSQGNGGAMALAGSTSTLPSHTWNNDFDTGVGRAAADQLSLIAGGVEMLRLQETGLATTDQVIIAPAGIIGDNATPALAFGDGDTGFYEASDDALRISIAGSLVWSFAGNSWESAVATGGASFLASAASSTVPVTTFTNDTDTGIGRAAADQLSLIAGGVEMLRLQETGLATTDQLIIGPAGVIGSAATPSLAFGDGDTGFYESADDSLNVSILGARRWWWSGNSFVGLSTAAAQIKNETPSDTNPVFAFSGDSDTGVGRISADQLSLIAGGVEAMRLAEVSSAVLISYQANVGLTADVGSAQGSGVITSTYNVYSTVATTGDAATLPATFPVGTQIYVKNDGANAMDVFPASGDDAGGGVDTAIVVAAGESVTFIATAASATWSTLIVGGGGITDGTVEGQMLWWDNTGGAWTAASNLLWDDTTLTSILTVRDTLSIEFTGASPGVNGITTFKNGPAGADIMTFYDTDGGGVEINEPTLRLPTQGGSAGSGKISLYSSGGGRAFIHNTHANLLAFGNESGTLGTTFAYPVSITGTAAPTVITDHVNLWGKTSAFGVQLFIQNDQGRSWPVGLMEAVSWTFNSPNTASDPGGTNFKTNTSDFSTVTEIYFNDEDSTGQDQGDWLGKLAVGDLLRIQEGSDANRWLHCYVDSITDNTGWWTLEVTVADHSGTNFVNGYDCQFSMEKHSLITTAPIAPIDLVDDEQMRFGTSQDVTMEWDTTTTSFLVEGAASNQDFQFRDGMVVAFRDAANTAYLEVQTISSYINFNAVGADFKFQNGTLLTEERASAAADQAGYGQWWLTNATQQLPMFTGDNGTDWELYRIGADLNMADAILTAPVLKDYSIEQADYTPSGTTQALVYADGPAFTVDLESASGNMTLSITGGPSTSNYGQIVVRAQQDGASAVTCVFGSGTYRHYGGTAHPMNTTLDGFTVWVLETFDAGTSWEVAGSDPS